ncbi:HD domain-containing phosphohydrolase [Polyangium sorediatum]|uniref:Response regulator n=1 Tax=Polyangium sorediatum TaxID=889274 RepID=A0ABT6P2R5_9BACT|nr:HD domain-containing phosphohydrolase [Polyangium sorediatum]MDI1434657.1 response regulator [Polyangium sorediatum]
MPSQLTEERPRILVVDDEKVIRDMLADFLGMEGYIVRTAEDGSAALGELTKSHYDLIISDLKMPKMGGIALLDEIGKTSPDALTVIMTGFGTVETAIDAMKRGAYDYVLKPFKLDEVIHVVQRGLEKQRMAAENLRLREALGLYKVSEAIQASLSLDQVLETVAESCLSEVRSDLVSTWLDDGEGGLFERQHIRGSSLPEDAAIGVLDHDKIATHLRAEATLLEQGPRGLKFFSAPPEVPLYSLVAVPLRIGQRFMGFIALGSFSKGRRFEEGQRKLLSIIASRAAAAIENARLYQDLQATFQQTIQGLAKAIDKMDRYTSGHSDRVALYAVFLARQLGLSAFEVEIVRQSALMHDIGKIGCVLNLNKPGKLTQDEYEVFKKHPVFGRDILDPIKFLHPLIPGVHLHHERWDGRGYPLKLKGNEIPIIARIIAVADTYDAMTSDRSYRRALPHEVALAEIERCSGSQFDPEVAANFTDNIEGYRDERRSAGDKVPE